MAGPVPLESNGGKPQPDTNDTKITSASLLRVLQGVSVATKVSNVEPVSCWISSQNQSAFTLYELRSKLALDFKEGEESRQIASLTFAIAFLREKSRQGADESISPSDLALVWSMIHGALTSAHLSQPLCSVSRSAQGFVAVPLCSLVKDGNIEELFRFHVWLPDGKRGRSGFAIHSHQPFAQSWILAGEGTDSSYEVERSADAENATHAEYELSWSAGKGSDATYKTHQTSSTVTNTSVFVRATKSKSATHTAGMTYSIPAATFHTSSVAPDAFHATLFFFDASRGFVKDARILGAKDGKQYVQIREEATITSTDLARMVETARSWEALMVQGKHFAQRAEWEKALQAYNSAISVCDSVDGFPNPAMYRSLVFGELGSTYRRFGRYEQAKSHLEQAVSVMEPNKQRIEFSGELGVIYRHMGRLEDAKSALEDQYNSARQLGFREATCRAIGNLGMVNYQISEQNHNKELLHVAINQQKERVQRSIQLKANATQNIANPIQRAQAIKTATMWECIGLTRISLCYTVDGQAREAISAAQESVDLADELEDSTVVAMSRFFLGRALFLDRQQDAALKQFNPVEQACTPAIAMCKEPSEESRQYLRELVDAGANLDLTDEHGYTALDYAVFSGSTETKELVLEGLRRQIKEDTEKQISQRLIEAELRKGYRDIFQEKLRPVLLGGWSDRNVTSRLRHVYAEALAADEAKRNLFDCLKSVRYTDFVRLGRLPQSSDGLARQYELASEQDSIKGDPGFLIFLSYRWINKESNAISPDDGNNPQYRRMMAAAEEFLRLNPNLERDRLSIWLDVACIDQNNPFPGVSALPMVVSQCDAVISLIDDQYYERAWCSVEVLMAQTLKKSYQTLDWYEQSTVAEVSLENSDGKGQQANSSILKEGSLDMEVIMKEKKLSFESDRPKVLFLERQVKLLG